MGRAGLEQTAKSPGKAVFSDPGGSKSVNMPQNASQVPQPATTTEPVDPDLREVVARWLELPLAVRAGIAAMVKAASPAKSASPPLLRT